MSNFLNAVKQGQNLTTSENGCVAFKSTMNALLDMFASIGAMRGKSEDEILEVFKNAFKEEPLLATKCSFWVRDARGGAGERQIFRYIIEYLAHNNPEYVRPNIWLFSEYGRYDDLMCLLDTPLENEMFKVIKDQLTKDYNSDKPSLLAKWMVSESSKNSPNKAKLAKKMYKGLGMNPKAYRKMLTTLRSKLNLVETKMCEKDWDEIEYDKIPSRAGMIYRQAFMRNDEVRYKNFIESLTKGEVKINSAQLYPYEIIAKVMQGSRGFGSTNTDEMKLMDGMWKNLPNYFGDNDESAMAVVDTSGSMAWENDGIAYKSAISLGIYMAERSKGAFKDHLMTFSNEPTLIDISKCNTIQEKYKTVSSARAMGGTNIEALFSLILDTAIANDLPQSDLPSRLFILTDCHFNSYSGSAFTGSRTKSLLQKVKKNFADNGYICPNIVFWVMDARTPAFPMTIADSGVQMISGHSPSLFKNLLAGKALDAIQLMQEVLNGERYQAIINE